MFDQAATAVIARERRRIAAMVAADVGLLDELLHPDLLFGHTDGRSEEKPAYLARIRSGVVRYAEANQKIEQTRIIGNTALITSHLTMRADLETGSLQPNVLGLTVWVLDDGAWRMIAHHPTVVTH